MSRGGYAFGENERDERARMAAVEEAFDARSRAMLSEVGVVPGWRCWEVGAGRGSIARWLAETVGARGHVVATDLDDRWFDARVENLVFSCHDVTTASPPRSDFDLIHTRFVLEHLQNPFAVITKLAGALRPGGVLVAEDAAGLHLAVSGAPQFERIAAAWELAGRAVGWNATYGHELIDDLRAAGLLDVRAREHRLIAPGGREWAHVRAGLERLRSELGAQGAAQGDVDEVCRCLEDPGILITGAPVISAAGWRRADQPS